MVFNGDLSLTGKMTAEESIFSFKIYTPGTSNSATTFVPYYNRLSAK